MHIPFTEIVQIAGALLAGGLVGLAFGQLQHVAWQRHQALQAAGRFHSGWTIVPGAFRRVAFLLLGLVLVQVVCPVLFTAGGQWWVSGGVVAGYGSILWRQVRRSLAQNR